MSIHVMRIGKGDTFSTADKFRVAFERNMMAEGRQSKADKRVSGVKAKLYRCTEAKCSYLCVSFVAITCN